MGEEETIVAQVTETAPQTGVVQETESAPSTERPQDNGGTQQADDVQRPEQAQEPEQTQQMAQTDEQPNVESFDQASLMDAMLEEDYGFRQLRRGQVVEGYIVQMSENEILVDVGSKSEGVVASREIDRLGSEGMSKLHEGDSILVYVISPEDKNGNVVLSLSRAQMERDWRKAQNIFEEGTIFGGSVAGFNKGGLIVRVGKVRGFVPASQVVSSRRRRKGTSGEEFLSSLVGQDMQLKIIEIDRSRNRLILSERAAQRDLRKQQKEQLLAELQEGDTRTGEVISLCDFGAFVDLGGADGLVHLSELSWRRVAHPSEVLEVGDEVEVYVLNVDRERKRIGLSLKRLEADPWSTIAERYHVDQLVEGTITKLVKFGAFARIFDDDIEGLIHLSELSDARIAHPREVVQEGEIRTLRVIRIDPDRRRIGLSLKRVASSDYMETDWQDGYDQAPAYSEEEAAIDDEE
jgi:small subunit ribosomal protein S1